MTMVGFGRSNMNTQFEKLLQRALGKPIPEVPPEDVAEAISGVGSGTLASQKELEALLRRLESEKSDSSRNP